MAYSCKRKEIVVFYAVMIQNTVDNTLFGKLSSLPPSFAQEVEYYVVNSVKVAMIKKCDGLLEKEGRLNLRKLFLVPVFTVSEFAKRIEETAPEMKTFFYKELIAMVKETEKKFSLT